MEGCRSLGFQGSSSHHSCWAERCSPPPWCPSGWSPHWCRYRASPGGCSRPSCSVQQIQRHNYGSGWKFSGGLIRPTCCRPPPIWRTWTDCWWGRGCWDSCLPARSQYTHHTLSGLWQSSSKGSQSSHCQSVAEGKTRFVCWRCILLLIFWCKSSFKVSNWVLIISQFKKKYSKIQLKYIHIYLSYPLISDWIKHKL